MSIKRALQTSLTQLVTSPKLHRWQRQRHGQPTEIEFFHKLDDPYSLLLLKCLPAFLKRFQLGIKITLVQQLPKGFEADRERWASYALRDAEHLAAFYGVRWQSPENPLADDDIELVARVLLSDTDLGVEDVLVATEALWAGKMAAFYELAQAGVLITSAEVVQTLRCNCERLLKMGHYQGGMIYCAGEWYWGLDRLGYLEQRMQEYFPNDSTHHFLKQYHHCLQDPKNASVDRLVFYFSFRSPYSYLALERAREFAVAFELDLDIRPVLPMVMRGLSVPRAKRLYIVRDAKREADSWGIPFGKICDPLGKGVNNVMALFTHAEQCGKAYPYCLTIARAVWSQGVDIAREKELQPLVETIGLDWQVCQALLDDQSWQEWAERHRREMLDLGCWGVPTFQLGDCVVWGQDRFWALEQALKT